MSDTKLFTFSGKTLKTIVAILLASIGTMVTFAFMTGTYWEKVNRSEVHGALIDEKLGKIENRVAAIDATLSFLVRNRVSLEMRTSAQP